MLHLIIFFADGEWPLKSYSGGSNPILVVLLAAIVATLIFVGLGFLAYQAYKKYQFNAICTAKGLTTKEFGYLKKNAEKLHIKDTMKLVSKRGIFDDFVNRVVQMKSHIPPSDEGLRNEMELVSSIREKLSFVHVKNYRNITSSRAFFENIDMHIFVMDENNQVNILETKIQTNNEFFLAVTAPTDEDAEELVSSGEKPVLEVTVIRPKDAEYSFDAKLMYVETESTPLWYFSHSKELTKGASQKPVNLEATVLAPSLADTSNIQERAVLLLNLQPQTCSFSIGEESLRIPQDANILLSFSLFHEQFSIRGKIIKEYKDEEAICYQVEIKQVEDEVKNAIIRFSLENRQKERLQKNIERQRKARQISQNQNMLH